MAHRLLALTLAIAIALSGCLSLFDGDEPTTGNDTDNTNGGHEDPSGADANGSDAANGTTDPAASDNETATEPVTASLETNLTELDVGVEVAFTLDGTGPFGTPLLWTLDLGDNTVAEGDNLPATVEHSYAQAGNFTVLLTVTAEDETATAHVDLTVIALPQPDPVSFEGSIMLPDVLTPLMGSCIQIVLTLMGLPGGHIGDDHGADLAPYEGWNYAFDNEDMRIDFWTGAGETLGGGNEGTIPEGFAFAPVCITDPTALMMDYTLTVTPPA